MSAAPEVTINGRRLSLETVSPNLTLLEFLRSLGLTGAKEGCAEGDCGACSVAVVDCDSAGKTCYRAINSCLVPVCLLAGREVISVEGVATGATPHPVQSQMTACHGSQCGYCTPGIVCSLLEGYYRAELLQGDRLDDQLCGNLCRCTGYRSIREAAELAFAERSADSNDRLAIRLREPAPPAAGTEYNVGSEFFIRPTTLIELLHARQDPPEGRLIAGATELGLDITKRFVQFPTLISTEAVPELREIRRDAFGWRIGAAATLTAIEERVEIPALADMLRVFGSRQIRNRATMGGNIV